MSDILLTPAQGAQQTRIRQKVDRIFESGVVNDRTASTFKKVLDGHYDHPFQMPSSLVESTEVEIRYDYAKEIESTIRSQYKPDFRLRVEHVAAILIVPLSKLRPRGRLSGRSIKIEGGGEIKGSSGVDLYDQLELMWSFSRHVIQKLRIVEYAATEASRSRQQTHDSESAKKPRTEPGPGLAPKDDLTGKGINTTKEEKRRDPRERQKCLDRDGKACRVMTTADPEVCHIIPWTFNNNKANLEKTASLFKATDTMFDEKNFFGEYFLKLANPAVLGGSDKVWNLICLNRQLHTWWGKGYLGFKCLGVELMESESEKGEAKVTLQFHWMPRLTCQYGQEMQATGQQDDYAQLAQEIREFHESGHQPAIHRDSTGLIRATLKSGEMLESGHLFFLQMEAEEALMFKDMIDLQWACIQMYALSGAAGISEFPTDDEPDDRTAQWIHDQAKWSRSLGVFEEEPIQTASPNDEPECARPKSLQNKPAEDEPTASSTHKPIAAETSQAKSVHGRPLLDSPLQERVSQQRPRTGSNVHGEGVEGLSLRPSTDKPSTRDSSPDKLAQRAEQAETSSQSRRQTEAEKRQAENRNPWQK